MFEKTKLVLGVSKTQIVAALVKPGSRKISKFMDFDWTPDNVKQVLQQIKEKYNATNVRIVLSDNISYLLNIKSLESVDFNAIENYLATKIAEEIPETLERGEWNYQEIHENDVSQFLVFAPVKRIFDPIKIAAEEVYLTIDLVEPEKFAKLRDPNPLIGTAKA